MNDSFNKLTSTDIPLFPAMLACAGLLLAMPFVRLAQWEGHKN